MNAKFLTSILFLMVGIAVSGTASAVPCTNFATVLDWANGGGVCEDPLDGDMQFTLNSYSIPDTTQLDVAEVELGGIDYYDLGLGWGPNGYSGGGNISYTMAALAPSLEQLASVKFGTVITGTGTSATKDLYNVVAGAISGPSFLSLTSTNGSDTGYVGFSPRSTIGVIDTFDVSTAGVFQDAHNSYTVPEPFSLSLLGIGLVGLGLNRRRIGRGRVA